MASASDASSFVEPVAELSVQNWRTAGFSLVQGILPKELVEAAAADVARLAPTNTAEFGGVLFPSAKGHALNQLVLHPVILDGVSKILGTDDIRLTQADAWAKIGTPPQAGTNQDQRVHIDAHNHTFVVPPAWDEPVAVALIVYLSDYVGGGTGIVPREGPEDPAYQSGKNLLTPGGATEYPWINDRTEAEAWMKEHAPAGVAEFRQTLYAREKIAHYQKGTVLFYRHDIWHRGRPLESGKTRLVLNLSFRRADCDYWPSWNQGWPQSNYDLTQFMEKLFVGLTPEQRSVLSFPMPGHRYWNERTLREVHARYQHLGFDIKPYREAFEAAAKSVPPPPPAYPPEIPAPVVGESAWNPIRSKEQDGSALQPSWKDFELAPIKRERQEGANGEEETSSAANDWMDALADGIWPDPSLSASPIPSVSPSSASLYGSPASSLIDDCVHEIFSFLSTREWRNAAITGKLWLSAAVREPCRDILLLNYRAIPLRLACREENSCIESDVVESLSLRHHISDLSTSALGALRDSRIRTRQIHVSDVALAATRLSGLLCFSGTISDPSVTLKPITFFPSSFTSLSLLLQVVTVEALQRLVDALPSAPKLRHLHLERLIKAVDLSPLRECKSLENLEITCATYTPHASSWLHATFPPAHASVISGMSHLKRLKVNDGGIFDIEVLLQTGAIMPSLVSLDIHAATFTAGTLARLAHLAPQLIWLQPKCFFAPDLLSLPALELGEGLGNGGLHSFQHLRSLVLCEPPHSSGFDELLFRDALLQCPPASLTHLGLERSWHFSSPDSWASIFAVLRKLRSLTFRWCEGEKFLTSLEKVRPRVKQLQLLNCHLSTEGRQEVQLYWMAALQASGQDGEKILAAEIVPNLSIGREWGRE